MSYDHPSSTQMPLSRSTTSISTLSSIAASSITMVLVSCFLVSHEEPWDIPSFLVPQEEPIP